MSQAKNVKLKIKRQESAEGPARYDHFEVQWLPQMNVISALMEVRKNPVTSDTKEKVAPVNWESNCLEEVCGACTMLINGRVRQACTALIDQVAPGGEEITLEPMSKFPLVRDLVVDRSRMPRGARLDRSGRRAAQAQRRAGRFRGAQGARHSQHPGGNGLHLKP